MREDLQLICIHSSTIANPYQTIIISRKSAGLHIPVGTRHMLQKRAVMFIVEAGTNLRVSQANNKSHINQNSLVQKSLHSTCSNQLLSQSWIPASSIPQKILYKVSELSTICSSSGQMKYGPLRGCNEPLLCPSLTFRFTRPPPDKSQLEHCRLPCHLQYRSEKTVLGCTQPCMCPAPLYITILPETPLRSCSEPHCLCLLPDRGR